MSAPVLSVRDPSGWRARACDPDAARELGRACGVGPTLAQVLLHRRMSDAAAVKAFLDPKLAQLSLPDGMADREAAVSRIARAVRAKERIVVFGDYDVDGTTSAAILATALARLGGEVVAFVANRFDGGYGFSRPALARAIGAGAKLIVTCDCGSSDHERIADAMKAGVDVVVIDHHLVPAEPLPAHAFLNPHRPDCAFPYKGMASAGLAFHVVAGVRKELGATMDMRDWLDLVALGTIADVAPLDGDNRVLVRAGLGRLAGATVRPGIAALREVAQVRPGFLSAIDVAFRLAPRLNAAGRLGDPAATLDLLMAANVDAARPLAAELERLNMERRALERRISAEATAHVLQEFGDEPPVGIVAAGEGWHRGVVGITAARLAERFATPTLVIAWDGDVGHGSGRAPDGFPLYDALATAKAHLEAFGGHNAATGFSLRRSKLPDLVGAFREAVRTLHSEAAPERLADVAIDGSVFDLPSADDLMRFEPLGESNPEPLFLFEHAEVFRAMKVGSEEAHLKLDLRVGPASVSAFGYDLASRIPRVGCHIRVLAHIRPDTWRGGRAVELRLVDFRSE